MTKNATGDLQWIQARWLGIEKQLEWERKHIGRATKHHIDCEWHLDQYDHECTCGATAPLPDWSTYNWQARISNYERETGFPKSLFVADDNRIVGTWILGNDYRVKSQYYGGYPNTFLKRVKALFPDKRKVLHLFSGRVDTSIIPGDTVDLNPEMNPSYLDDAQTLMNVPLEQYDLVIADPPYSIEDAEHYQTSMVKRTKVFRALQRLSPGTHVVILDQVLWQWRKDFFSLEAVIGVVRSTNHRFRVLTIFRRT